MTGVMSIALSGLTAAQTRLTTRARNIVNAATPGYVPDEIQQISTPFGPLAQVVTGRREGVYPQTAPAFATITTQNKVNLEAEMVDFKLAAASYKMSVALFKTAQDVERSALEILA